MIFVKNNAFFIMFTLFTRPTIIKMEWLIKRKKKKVIIATEIEAIVESLFIEED